MIAGLVCGYAKVKGITHAALMFLVFVSIQILGWLYIPIAVMLLRPPRKEFVLLFFVSMLGAPIAWQKAGIYIDFSGPNLSVVSIRSHYPVPAGFNNARF